MKVLQINSVYGIGSTGRIATEIYHMLEAQGHECVIAYGRNSYLPTLNAYQIGKSVDIYKHVIKTRLTDNHGFGSKKATEDFILEIDKINPDVIHLHNIHGYFLNLEIMFNYLRECNKPIIWTLHDCWAFTGHCAYFDYVGCEKWKTQCGDCPQIKEYPKSLFIDHSDINYARKKALFSGIKNLTLNCPSDWLSEMVKQSFLKDYPCEVIKNGIDLSLFKPSNINGIREKYNIQDKFVLLGVASVWDRRKGLDYFIELSKMLDSSYQIIVVGLTKKQQEKLPSNILGITKTNNINELVELYNTADIFVNPTLEETLGLVNVEALATGTPVITFNSGGSPECIDENCGVVVEKGNVEELYRNILRFTEFKFSPEDCMAKSKEFDKTIKYQEYIELYKKSIKQMIEAKSK